MTRINQLGKIRRFGVVGTATLVGHGLNYYTRKYVLWRQSLVRRIHDYKLCLDLRDGGLSKDIAIRGTREEQLKYIIDREVGPGDVVLDIGANIGYYTIMLASRVGDSGRVYAIEPEPKNFELLRTNIELNGVGSVVKAYWLGASDAQGAGRLYVHEFSNLHSFLPMSGSDSNGSAGQPYVEVPLTDVSSFIQGKRPVDLLRMDIEGYEVEVIRGLERAIADGSFSGKILFECHFPRYNDETHSMREPLTMLLSHGYHGRYLTSTDERRPRIRELGYEPTSLVQTNDRRFRGVYENVAGDDVVTLICKTGGVRDIMLEKRA